MNDTDVNSHNMPLLKKYYLENKFMIKYLHGQSYIKYNFMPDENFKYQWAIHTNFIYLSQERRNVLRYIFNKPLPIFNSPFLRG